MASREPRAQAAACMPGSAAERAGDLLLVVEQDVEGEIHPSWPPRSPGPRRGRVAVDDAPRGSRIADTPRVVEHRASSRARRVPGATILGPPLNPAKKCGSTKPVVIRTSAATHSRSRKTGTSRPSPGRPARASSRASWSTTRHCASTSSPSIAATLIGRRRAMRAGGDQDDDVFGPDDPVERLHDRLEHQGRGCGRVTSQTEIATR